LRDADQRTACIHVGNDPIAVEGLVFEQRIEAEAVDQGGDADRVKAVPRQQDEMGKVAECVRQGKDLGRPTALRLAYRLPLGPPF